MARTIENETFNNAGNDIVNASFNLAKTLPKGRVSKRVNIPRYSNIGNMSTSGSTPQSIAGLGTVTTAPGESTRYESNHPGIDIANAIGTAIPSFTEGVVTNVVSGHKQGDPGYGNYVEIRDPKGLTHRYSHLRDAVVRKGDRIIKGARLGSMGNTGQTYSLSGGTGSHLDYRILDAFGKYVNPLIYVK